MRKSSENQVKEDGYRKMIREEEERERKKNCTANAPDAPVKKKTQRR